MSLGDAIHLNSLSLIILAMGKKLGSQKLPERAFQALQSYLIKAMAQKIKLLYLGYLLTNFDEFLHAEIFCSTWKACKVSTGSQRPQGQRSQGYKGRMQKISKLNFRAF